MVRPKFWPGKFIKSDLESGAQLVLYAICVSYLWKRPKLERRVKFLQVAYITVLLVLESLFVSAYTWTLEEMYINNRNFPGGPMAWFLVTQNAPENTFFASLFSLTFLSDLLVVSSLSDLHSLLRLTIMPSYGVVGLFGDHQENRQRIS
jgi:hypothetical protein